MTLTTKLRIVEPTAIDPIWQELHRLIRARPDIRWSETKGAGRGSNNTRDNAMGQGYVALCWMEWGADGPLDDGENVGDAYQDKHVWWECEGDTHSCPPAASIELFFDTPYSYHAENGANSGDLHAWLIREMGRFISGLGLTWLWFHEFDCEWHSSTDPVTLLGNPDRGEPAPGEVVR